MADPPALDDWKARSKANLEANGWVAPPPGTMRAHPPEATGKTVQESYVEAEHPRDRLGRFRDIYAPQRFELGDVLIGPDVSPSNWRAFRPAEYDADVQKVTDAKGANAILRKIGLTESDVSVDAAHTQPDEDWYRQVTQAAKDMVAKFPALTKGPNPLRGVRVVHRDDLVRDDMRDTVWAYTGPDPRTTPTTSLVTEDGDYQAKGDLFIGISEKSDVLTFQDDVSDFAAPAGGGIYGRLVHEFGHAVGESAGLASREGVRRYGVPEGKLLERFGLTPRFVMKISEYAASNAGEAWAEMFTTLNTPNALGALEPWQREKVEAFRKGVNEWWSTVGGQNGPLL